MKLIFSPKSELDISEIRDFISLDNPYRAKSFTNQLRQSAFKIANLPFGYQQLSKNNKNLRRKIHGNYAIYYSINDETVNILRIIHTARKIKLKDLIS